MWIVASGDDDVNLRGVGVNTGEGGRDNLEGVEASDFWDLIREGLCVCVCVCV